MMINDYYSKAQNGGTRINVQDSGSGPDGRPSRSQNVAAYEKAVEAASKDDDTSDSPTYK